MIEGKLVDAIGFIDDSLIEETDKIRSRKKHFTISRIALVAACLVIFLAAVVFTYPIFMNTFIETEESYSSGNDCDDITRPSVGNGTSNEDHSDKEESNTENTITGENAQIESNGTATDNSVSVVPLFVTIESITDEGITCTIIDTRENKYFSKGDILFATFSENADIPGSICAGDRVFITYSLIDCENKQIMIQKLYYDEGETTPAFFGGKK